MIVAVTDNNIDDGIDEEIFKCLNPDELKSFFLFAGAGSGKTATLVNVLTKFKMAYGTTFRLNRQKIAVITYTNAASDEIKHRLDYSSIFQVSTIHSFAWELIKPFVYDMRTWLRTNLQKEIGSLEEEQSRSRNLQNKTSIDRAKKIESKTRRLNYLDRIIKFTYNPNGDNTTKDSLNHSEVINIAAEFIKTKPLMQDILVSTFPILLIDESQDTKKDLIDAFFELQINKSRVFSIGLFGDTMQRIYSDGKENLDKSFPADWVTPVKHMNHRSNKRIVKLINNIRQDVDAQKQQPRSEKPEGFVRLFICSRKSDKNKIENIVMEKMAEITNDNLWTSESKNIKTLILEHHMAARRMGFLEFFEPLYKQGRLSTGLLDGSLATINFFTKEILSLIEAKRNDDNFEIARVVKRYSKFLQKENILVSTDQLENITKSKEAVDNLFILWNDNNDPQLIEVLNNIKSTGLFPIPESFYPIVSRTEEEKKIIMETSEEEDDVENADEIINAWDEALKNPFSQIKSYNDYISESSKFGTHQGVKGLEYDRVMVILDDEESRGFLFSYDKLFGAKDLSDTDKKNIKEGKETGIDRTRRLFYVACSRAKESLAIVAYTDQVNIVKENALKYGWFSPEEVVIIDA